MNSTNVDLDNHFDSWVDQVQKLSVENARLRARCAELEADAARYRWLRDRQVNLRDLKGTSDQFVAMNIACEMYGHEWDAAIDAARAQGGWEAE